ncbi:hypothetical protein EEL40_14725, partial [Muribaculaceae bacterium Isolate-083 (Janvier)]
MQQNKNQQLDAKFRKFIKVLIMRFERTEQSYDIWLDEKKKLSDEDYRNPNIVARGYTDYVTIQ